MAASDSWSASELLEIASCLPVVLSAFTIIYDSLHIFRYPLSVSSAYRVFTSPFQNFLHLDDLAEAVDIKPKVVVPRWKPKFLLSISLLETLLQFTRLVITCLGNDFDKLWLDLCLCLAWSYSSLRIWRRTWTTPPYLLFFFYICSAGVSLAKLIIHTIQEKPDYWQLNLWLIDLTLPLLMTAVIGTLPVKDTLPGPFIGTKDDCPSNTMSMPEDSVTLWQWCTFSFVEPLFKVASLRRLEETDVWTLSPYFKHKNLFNKQLEYFDSHPNHSLVRFLIMSNFLDLILDIVLELWSALGIFVCTYSLQRILLALEASPRLKFEAYFYAFVTFLTHLSFAQVDLFQSWYSRRAYERARGQIFCALHYKALRRRDKSNASHAHQSEVDDKTANDSADLGKIVNLMQGDAYKLSHRFWQASLVFALSVRLVFSLVFLHSVLGWSSMAGVVVVLIAYILNYPVGKYNVKVARQSWKARDIRMSSVNELFQSIRFLKFYGWESHWARNVSKNRETELKWRVKENICAVLISFIWIWVPSAMAFFSFLFYTIVAGGQLTVSKTFVSLSLFSALQSPMMELPEQFFEYLYAYVSYQRINAFLHEEEVPEWASSLKRPAESRTDKIGFKGATFEWNTAENGESPLGHVFRLGPLDIEFPIGRLSLITGPTGSGKSALLGSLLGELNCTGGEVLLDKSSHHVAYCAQAPWLEHATIRDNIIFKSDRGFDKARYQEVLEACALTKDLAMFEAGDMTEIGEKGVTLSGGQRARVALARAVYSEAKCILLDDPLAAVDMHTAQHIVKNCFQSGLVRGRTVILVTHHISLCLSTAYFIAELSDGKIIRQGTVSDMDSTGQLKDVIQAEDATASVSSPTEAGGIIQEVNEADIDYTSNDSEGNTKGKLVEAEHRAKGRVSMKTYITYIRAAGWFSWFFTFALMIFLRLLAIGNDLFLAKWSEAYETRTSEGSYPSAQALLLVQTPMRMQTTPLDKLPPPSENTIPWFKIYLWISLVNAFSTLIYIILGYYASLQASRKLFVAMLNRFTADINIVDSTLQSSARATLTACLSFISSFVVIICVIPQFAPFAIFVAWLYIRLAPAYIRTARDLRRLESVSLSPAFAGFDELLRGITTVRAFGMEHKYQDSFYGKIDLFQGFDHVYWLVSGWLRWRYDCLGSVIVFITGVFAIWNNASDGFTAVVLTQAGIFAEANRQLVRVASQLELDFNSVERIDEYLAAPQEASLIVEEKRPPAYWPSSSGNLSVENLVIRYASDLPPVLKGISFTVKPGEKIGIVGRTGSGKSTLALSLLRVIEPSEGRIILDGIDVCTIGLEDLRKRVTIVSQDVSLFSGTIRSNLDPLGEHTELECLDVLERCHLIKRDGLRNITRLDASISPNGSLSAGERQLVALARAILRHSQVIIMDEATSQIDSYLDDQIQRTVREELASAMVITIAHRLKTIIDYDRILVLGDGNILEFDTPRNLFNKQGGAFREMCKKSADWDELKKLVEKE